MSTDPCLDAAIEYVKELETLPPVVPLIPRPFYFHLKEKGHIAWATFQSTALPTFPRSVNTNTKQK